ncbi:ATPase family associated with various cellular activities (AAA) [Pseudobutyrivibrio sp. YE44]|uniref:AAA family ATPase n=1 Tax=Pseudobutyrivibrio sp. YE44 TaxID=1520802 RepID=UPI00088D07FC|nr:AAA family ATPase [Pseudobutyrivibrio sp. YE44]SDB55661.1 ATPase family associated with various cellular activities (AAA) [Pseudobutyrivibrio sp. YE44]
MLCYTVKFKLTAIPEELEKEEERRSSRNTADRVIKKINQCINGLAINGEFYCFAFRSNEESVDIAVSLWPDKITLADVNKQIQKAPNKTKAYVIGKVVSNREITAKYFVHLQEEADNRGYFDHGIRRSEYDLQLDYFDNSYFKINEYIAKEGYFLQKDAIEEAKSIMADKSLLDEIERIYSSDNALKFYGHPVHYKIQAGDQQTALVIIDLMVRMLHTRHRSQGVRINVISDLSDRAFDETDLKKVFKQSGGGILVIDAHGDNCFTGNFANSYKRLVKFLGELATEYHKNTLFFFLEDLANPGFSKELLARVSEDLDIIGISEGAGNRDEALAYFRLLSQKTEFAELVDDSIDDYLSHSKKVFKCFDVQKAYNKWSKEILKSKVYSAYSNCKMAKIVEKKKGTAYEELQDMVGLSEVKNLIDSIIAAYKVQKYRETYGLCKTNMARHMVFTGNPGCAKTTVARLLTDVLTEEGVLKSGAYVECGRSDLVGQYVGWTAPAVVDKFKEASGGVLFIDEAYSLVEKDGLYGDEAINTIVQEMENHRNSVIVIFAGYPDKMKKFLDKNEGLRSRIAFHLGFPDYKPEELLDIMRLMLRERGLKADKEAEQKCLRIFEQAYQIEEYGNGRFVRNLVERAILKQAQRLMKRKNATPTRGQIMRLTADDFDETIIENLDKKQGGVIGFAV